MHLAVRGSLYTRGRKNSTGSYNAAGPYTRGGGQGMGGAGDVAHLGFACISDAGASPHPLSTRCAPSSRPGNRWVSLACTTSHHGMFKKKKKNVGGKSHCGISSQAWSNEAWTKVIPKQSDTATARCSFNNWHNALPAALLRRTAVRLPAWADSCCCCGGYKYKLLTSATTVVCRSSSISISLTALGSTLNAQGDKATFNK